MESASLPRPPKLSDFGGRRQPDAPAEFRLGPLFALRPAVSPVDLALRPVAEAQPGGGKPSGRSRLSLVGETASN